MTYKNILKIVPTLQAAKLVGELSKKKKKPSLVKDATKILVGVPLIKLESDLIAGL